MARAAVASAATVDSIEIWSRSSSGHPPEIRMTVLSPGMRPRASNALRRCVTLTNAVDWALRQADPRASEAHACTRRHPARRLRSSCSIRRPFLILRSLCRLLRATSLPPPPLTGRRRPLRRRGAHRLTLAHLDVAEGNAVVVHDARPPPGCRTLLHSTDRRSRVSALQPWPTRVVRPVNADIIEPRRLSQAGGRFPRTKSVKSQTPPRPPAAPVLPPSVA